MRRFLLALLIVLPLVAGVVYAGEDDALDLVDEAAEALDAEEYRASEKLYRRAIKSMGTCLPAHFGLGEALWAQDKHTEALVAYRTTLRVATANPDIPSAWQKFVGKALRRLDEHDKRGKELEELVDKHVSDLMKLAAAQKSRDPDLADRMIDIVLRLRPEHERALEIRGGMAAKGARREAIFDGKQIADWDGGRSKWWGVEDGAIVAKAMGVASYIRNQKQIKGNFDVIMEARITETGKGAPFIALMASWTAEYTHCRFGTLHDVLTWYEYFEDGKKDQVFREPVKALRKPIDPAKWTVYELHFREKYIHALVGGREVHKIERTKLRAGGYVGILAQDCRAEIKRLDVLHR